MTNEQIVQLMGIILGSSLISSVVVALLGRRKESAEAVKYTAEARGEDAETVATWVEISLKLQEQRDRDYERYQQQLEMLDTRWQIKYGELESKLEGQLDILRAENMVLRNEREEWLEREKQLVAQIDDLTQRLNRLENGGI